MIDPLDILRKLQGEPGQAMLPDSRLHEIFESDVAFAREHAKDGLHMMFTVHGRPRDGKGDWVVIPMLMADWPPPQGKAEGMRGLGVMFHEKFPNYMPMCVSQMSEAWMSQYEKGDPAYDAPDRPMPSKDPKRIECVLVSTISMDQRQDTSMEEILRTPAGIFMGTKPFLENRYDPAKPVQDPRTETNYLILDFYMGYFASLGSDK